MSGMYSDRPPFTPPTPPTPPGSPDPTRTRRQFDNNNHTSGMAAGQVVGSPGVVADVQLAGEYDGAVQSPDSMEWEENLHAANVFHARESGRNLHNSMAAGDSGSSASEALDMDEDEEDSMSNLSFMTAPMSISPDEARMKAFQLIAEVQNNGVNTLAELAKNSGFMTVATIHNEGVSVLSELAKVLFPHAGVAAAGEGQSGGLLEGFLAPDFMFQRGGCSASISDCFVMKLSATAGLPHLPANRGHSAPLSSRNRLATVLTVATALRSAWKYELAASVTTGSHFFHISQLISRRPGAGGPIVTLNALAGQITFSDPLRKCNNCKKIPLTTFAGIVTQHTVKVTYGKAGSINWQITNAATGKTLLSYSATGDMGDHGSIKMGLYRRFVDPMSAASAFIGDYSSTLVK
ncbi:hypothetical protein RQP46_008601 [Phenoliferia psychrophenolica]